MQREIGDVDGAEAYFQRALRVAPDNAPAAYGLALLAYRAGRATTRRARWMSAMPAAESAAPKRSISACASSASSATAQAETSYIAQLRNRYPDSAETRAIATGACE